jgi:predicted RNase H-like HicB family nuclease
MDLTVVISEEGAGYWSEIPELPGCFASGRDLNDLRVALGEAIGLYLWDRPAELVRTDLRTGTTTIRVKPSHG